MNQKKLYFIQILLIAAFALAAYSQSLNGGFVLDDEMLIVNSVYIRDFSHLKHIFTSDAGSGSGKTTNYYRPLQIISYCFDYLFWKLNPQGYRLVNLILHILAAICVGQLARILFGDWLLGLIAGVLFAIHPVGVESVAYIAARSEIMTALFLMICFFIYLRCQFLDGQKQNKILYFLLVFFYCLALLSKENALVFPFFLLFYDYTFKTKPKKRIIFVLLGIAVLYLFIRMNALGLNQTNTLVFTGLAQRLPGVFVAFASYIKMLFLPIGLHMDYGSKIFKFNDLIVILSVLFVVFIIFYVFRKKKSNRLLFFSAGWFFIMLLPASNIYPISAFMAERYVYLPSIGFFFIISFAIAGLLRQKPYKNIAIIFLIILSIFYLSLTMRQSYFWKNSINLYGRAVEIEPDNYRMIEALAGSYYKKGQVNEAVKLYFRAININPGYWLAYNNLGNIYHETGKDRKALYFFNKTVEINPGYAQGYYNLGIIYNSLGYEDEALSAYQKAVALSPGYGAAYNNLAVLYYKRKNCSLAKEHCLNAQKNGYKVNPNFLNSVENCR